MKTIPYCPPVPWIAIAFYHASDMVAMGFHEVTKYWIKYPTAVGPAADALIVTVKEWNRLPDKLKAIVETAVEAGTARNHYEGERQIGEAWKYVQAKGIKIIELNGLKRMPKSWQARAEMWCRENT